MKLITRILAPIVAVFAIGSAVAAEAALPLDPFPTQKLKDESALQNGAQLFVNYCMGCHGAALMRYNRLHDIGLTDEQIRENLVFDPDGKVGDLMQIPMRASDSKEWFGATPPDLSVTVRARASSAGSGSDWLFTYLRSYFRDETRTNGWNNAVFEDVGMPNPFWELQGVRKATLDEVREVADETSGKTSFVRSTVSFDVNGTRTETSEQLEGRKLRASRQWSLAAPEGGSLSEAEFDAQVADLTAFLTYVSDPSARTRTRLGVWVLLFLGVFTIFAWMLNREYWKDVQ